MRFRPANSSSTVMQSAVVESAENLTSSRFNTAMNRSMKQNNQLSPLHGIKKAIFLSATSPIHSPVPKKHKSEIDVAYPEEVQVPSKSLVRALYESIVSQNGSHQNQLDEAGSGLLSLEEVILPAVAREESNAIKKLQAKAQRDAPLEVVDALKQCRAALYESVECGIVAARAARLKREAEEHQRLMKLQRERAEAKERRRMEREEKLERRKIRLAEERKQTKERKRMEMKKQLPKNVEMWREVAFLMTQQATMKKEERMWMEAEQKLDVKAQELERMKEECKKNKDENDATEEVVSVSNIDDAFQERVASAIEDITLSSLRIQRAADSVSSAVTDANLIRSELFHKYTGDHQFHGYAGVKDPKSLIRILSQGD